MIQYRDRDFIQTREGFFFCVVGPFHPLDRVFSYLKYVPSNLGVWGRRGKRFKRVMRAYTIPSLLETFNFLEKDYPHYLFYSSIYNITMTAAPHKYIAKNYKPEEKLTRLLRARRLDPLQNKLKKLMCFLAEKSGVSPSSLGVTGSILLNIHRPEFSDIDLTVYGFKDSLAIKDALIQASLNLTFQRLKGEALKTWCLNKAQYYPLTVNEAYKIHQRKWNYGLFEDTSFSIHPVKLKQEVKEVYGEKIFHPVTPITIIAIVQDNTDALFLPSVYQVQEVRIIDGPHIQDIREVVSYEGFYADLAEVGESIMVRGKLERVLYKRTGKKHYRVVVGSPEGKGKEYIKLTPSQTKLNNN